MVSKVSPWTPAHAVEHLANMGYRTMLANGALDPAHLVYEPDLRSFTEGERRHVVVDTKQQLHEKLWLCQLKLSRQLVLVQGHLEEGTWTLLNIKLSHLGEGKPLMVADEVTSIHLRIPSFADGLPMVELCSGFGFASQGATVAGFTPLVKVEKQANTVTALLQMGEQAIHGDVQHPLTVKKVLDKVGVTCPTVLLCFACQPFSRFGDQKGMMDDRAGSLKGGLVLSYLLWAPMLVMENVSLTFNHYEVNMVLDQLMVLMDFERTQTTLDLAHQWSSARERTWVVLYPPWLQIKLQPWMQDCKAPTPTSWQCLNTTWTQPEIDELILTEEEATLFLAEGTTNYFAEDKEKLPTALHSLGNHLWPCPCGCRTSPLNPQRLKERGISTILVRLKQDPTRARHIHPRELALALGIALPNQDLRAITPLRHWLAQLGQCASPLQAAWIFGHLAQQIETFVHNGLPSPDQALGTMKDRTITSWLTSTAAQDLPPSQPPTARILMELHSWDDSDDTPAVVLPVSNHQSHFQLFQAEATLQGLILDNDFTSNLPVCDGMRLDLKSHAKPPSRGHGQAKITLLPPLVQDESTVILPQRCRLFQILRTYELPVEGRYIDTSGNQWPSDALIAGEITLHAHESSLQFGRGPKRSEPSLHRYEPATPGHYARWRLDLADSIWHCSGR